MWNANYQICIVIGSPKTSKGRSYSETYSIKYVALRIVCRFLYIFGLIIYFTWYQVLKKKIISRAQQDPMLDFEEEDRATKKVFLDHFLDLSETERSFTHEKILDELTTIVMAVSIYTLERGGNGKIFC